MDLAVEFQRRMDAMWAERQEIAYLVVSTDEGQLRPARINMDKVQVGRFLAMLRQAGKEDKLAIRWLDASDEDHLVELPRVLPGQIVEVHDHQCEADAIAACRRN